jgi:SAM-dependent methyltransferase
MAPLPHPPPHPSPLVLTGERTRPGIADERYWFARHEVAYLAVADLIREHQARVVLDAGCGEGYGLPLLRAAGATRVVGVDLDAPTVAHARATYGTADPHIEVVEAELSSLPLADDEVDLTVSLQVIEHLWDVPAYLASLRRVTRPGGLLAIATPNRLTFTPDSDTPVNPFHVREFTADELVRVLTDADLEVETVLGVHHGARLQAAERRLARPLPVLLGDLPPDAWDDELRAVVHATTAADLEVHDDDLDASLDLLAVAHVPAATAT